MKDKQTFGTIAAIGLIISIGTGAINFGLKYTNTSFDLFEPRFPRSDTFIDNNSKKLVAELAGDWKFRIGDDLKRAEADFDDSPWGVIDVPASWESEGYKNYDGFAWYRKEFSIDSSDTSKPLYALLGRIDDADEVFINGTFIGGTGTFPPTSISAWNTNRIYPIPNGIVADGRNTIAVRVYDSALDGGITNGTVGIYASTLPQPIVDLGGTWKFTTVNDPQFANENFDDSKFEKIKAPSNWEDQGYPDYDGHAWYRKNFTLSQHYKDEDMALLIGKIDDTDEVYLNGTRIGNTGTLQYSDLQTNKNYYAVPRIYYFPSSLLKENNTIAVHVHDSGGIGGIYEGPIGIMTQSEFEAYTDAVRNNSKWNFSKTWDWLMGKD